MKQFKTVDEYINSFPKETRLILQKLMEMVKEEIPKGEETISYNIPTFKLNGKYVVYFAAWTNHISIYPLPHGTDELRREMSRFIAGKGTLKFKLNKPVPYPFIRKIVKLLVEENRQ